MQRRQVHAAAYRPFVERHLEKNAGSTFREVLAHSERMGKCMYWGFQQRSSAWIKMISAMRNLV